jgi:hypothetical protein
LRGALAIALAVVMLGWSRPAAARDPGDPIRLAWQEGDVAGVTRILSADGGRTIGFIDYHQHRTGDRLEIVRVAHFNDGSSDEDHAEARVAGDTLEGVRGRSIIRDTRGRATADITIDVPAGHVKGFSTRGADRQDYDEQITLPAGTYWGPLISLVVKNFDQNATDDRVVFHTVAMTPKPRAIDMELETDGETSIVRPGGRLRVAQYSLKPTVNFLIDPVIQRLAPKTEFFVEPGSPPAMIRFAGPRNYAGQMIRIE